MPRRRGANVGACMLGRLWSLGLTRAKDEERKASSSHVAKVLAAETRSGNDTKSHLAYIGLLSFISILAVYSVCWGFESRSKC